MPQVACGKQNLLLAFTYVSTLEDDAEAKRVDIKSITLNKWSEN